MWCTNIDVPPAWARRVGAASTATTAGAIRGGPNVAAGDDREAPRTQSGSAGGYGVLHYTSTLSGTRHPVWEEGFHFWLRAGEVGVATLVVRVKDKALFGASTVGAVAVPLAPVASAPHRQLAAWYPLAAWSGPSGGGDAGGTVALPTAAQGGEYRGRVYLSLELRPVRQSGPAP